MSTPNTITVADSGAGNDSVSILGGAGTTCLNAAGNHITASGAGSYAMSLAAGAGTFNIEGLTGGTDAASVETYLETLTSPLNTLSGAAGGVLASAATYSVPGRLPDAQRPRHHELTRSIVAGRVQHRRERRRHEPAR